MYEQKFGLNRNPFRTMAEGQGVFVALKQAKALSSLQNALRRPDSVVTVSGPAGVGKTTIVARSLLSSNKLKVVAWIRRMRLAPDDVLQLLLNGFGISSPQNGAVQRYATFQRMLRDRAAAGSRVTIVIEDALHLSNDSLLEVEALTAADENGAGGANIILMGAPEIAERLEIPQLARLRQRTRKLQTVEPLNVIEVQGYLKHCMRVAEADYDNVFAEGSATMLYCCSEGIPRVINNICDAALTAAAEKGIDEITAQLLRDIALDEYGIEPIPVPEEETMPEASTGVPAQDGSEVETEDASDSSIPVMAPEAEEVADHSNPVPEPEVEVVDDHSDPAPEPEAEVVDDHSDPVPEPEAEVVDDHSDPVLEAEAEPELGSEAEFELEAEVGTALLRKLEYDPEAEEEATETEAAEEEAAETEAAETEAEAESCDDAEAEPEPEPEYELETELGTAQLRKLEIDFDFETGTETLEGIEAEAESGGETKVDPELDPNPESKPGNENESLSEANSKVKVQKPAATPEDAESTPALSDASTVVEPEKKTPANTGPKVIEQDEEAPVAALIPDLDALEVAIQAAQAGEPLCEETESKDTEADSSDTEITLDKSLGDQPAEVQEPDTTNSEVADAGTLENISEQMAETLFGVEFQQETAEALANSQAAGTILSEPNVVSAAAVDSFPSDTSPANDPNSQSTPVMLQRKTAAPETAAASAISADPEPDDYESPTSLNNTLKLLDKTRAKDEKPRGFFGRFKKTLGR